MPEQEHQNEAILVELGIGSRPDVLPTHPVGPRSPRGESLSDPGETETTLLAAVPQTTPWHQW